MMQHLGTNLLARSPNLSAIHASAPISTRPDLPSRNVAADTIEEAFVQFILSCNPAIPEDTDTAALREAFRTPPKSGGKSFSTWTLFDLIAQFQSKEIKTWGELALKLGVEPPDQDKGQSSQKIQQYAVRLKRWMHSMHIDAFFEYLLDNSHPYWTDIPLDPNPVGEAGRDGVAAEDDMALRSLLPHIKPRRARKRSDGENISRSPSQKPKMEPGSDQSNSNLSRAPPRVDQQQQLDLWAAAATTTTTQPDARSGAYLFAQDQFTRMNLNLATPGPWTGEDFVAQTPMTAHPYSAVTPATAGAATYWSEQLGDAKSGMTPTKSKTNRRHGAKVVSSAWRSGGPGGSGKTRGRPPLHRQTSQAHSQGDAAAAAVAAASSFSAFHSAQSTSPPPLAFRHPSLHHSPQVMGAALRQQHPMMTLGINDPTATITSTSHHPQQGMGGTQHGYDVMGQNNDEAQQRNLRMTRSRLSLQVPERTGAEVQLATPRGQQQQQQVPAVIVNGAMPAAAGDQGSNMVHHHQHHQHHQQSMDASMAGSDVHMMDPFTSAAAQSMYNMQYQHPQQIHHIPQTPQDTSSLYSTATTSTHHTAASNHPNSSPAPTTTLLHRPPPPAAAESTSAANTRPDRTNLDALESLLTYELLSAEWPSDAPQGGAAVDKAGAVARAMVESVRQEAGASAHGFLMNVAAIAGAATWLKAEGSRVRVQRMEGMGVEGNGERRRRRREVYDVHWEVQLGDVRSGFSLRGVVGRERWVKGRGGDEAEDEEQQQQQEEEEEEDEEEEEEEGAEDAESWRDRYRGLLDVVQEQDAELRGFRQGMIDMCRPRNTPREGGADDEPAG